MSQPWLDETPDVVAKAIYQALLALSGSNGHHTFEDICREFARARITHNITVATGPVSAGGDQGRDFESFRSYIPSLPGSDKTGRLIVFACTLQREDLSTKIKNDIAEVVKGREIDDIYVFTVHDVTAATRHRLQQWARQEHDLELDMFDGRTLAARLSDPDLRWIAHRKLDLSRTLLFGDSPDTLPGVIHANALVRGPVEALPGLAEKFDHATADEADKPLQAAARFQEIARSLEKTGYRGHALLMRLRAGAALQSGGDCDSAAIMYADIVERYSHTEGPDEDSGVRHRLSELTHTAELNSPAKERAAAALAVHTAAWHALDDLTALATAVDALADLEDAHLPKYILTLGEAAIASEQPDVILTRLAAFVAAIGQVSGIVRTRLKLVVADATGDWQDIVVSAQRRRLPPREGALVLARYARHLTLIGAADAAIEMWWDAIHEGALAGLGDDTAEWLYAVRSCMSIYGPDHEWKETHPLAQAIRASGGTPLLAQRRNHLEDAATALRRQKYARAAHGARRARHTAVISAHFATEVYSLDLLAEIYAKSNEHARAAHLYARCGQSEAIEKILGGLDDEYLDLTSTLTSLMPRHRAAGFIGMARQSDLIPDDQADDLVAIALNEWEGYCAGRIRQGQVGPSSGLAALKLLAALIERGTTAQASRLLESLSPWAPRDKGKYHFSDQDHINALAEILFGHESLSEQAADQLIQMISSDGSAAHYVAGLASAAITEHADVFAERLEALAPGNSTAARLLVRMNRQPADTTTAIQARDRLLAPYNRQAGRIDYAGGLGKQAALVTTLPEEDREEVAEALVVRAQDRKEVASNRCEAMAALATLAQSLSPSTRERLFEMGMSFAQGEEDATAYHGPFAASHPLSLFRIDLGTGNLPVSGLRLASVTCRDDQAPQVDRLGTSIMSSADDRTVHEVATALCWLPLRSELASAAVLIGHPHSAVRALAASRWARIPEHRDERTGQRLARDSAAIVRRTLAESLGESDLSAPDVLDLLLKDRRYSVRRLARRALSGDGSRAGSSEPGHSTQATL